MAKKATEHSRYESRYGGGWVAPQQILAEVMCERQAAKEKKKPSTSKKADYNKATYNHYKSLGYWVYRVDYFDHRLSRQHDFLGFADMMALGKNEQILIQLTSRSNMGERKKKILALPSHKHWLESGGLIHVIGWEKDERGRLKSTTIIIGATDETKHSETTGTDVPC